MHSLEPFYNWRHIYVSEEDPNSPFFKKVYNNFTYHEVIYNHYIHPQWDYFGSETLYLKILFVDYKAHTACIELIGEWNDAIGNDISFLKRNVVDVLSQLGICKYILIVENVLSFHHSDRVYYEEWVEDVKEFDGWIVALNASTETCSYFQEGKINRHILFTDCLGWRKYEPENLFKKIDSDFFGATGLIE
ncbi:MAG: hypothetical protein QM528_09505 [Phycisphaerales bacterium]|nr:hypothetical protein [Phycisphaerales bacterium]